MLCESTSPLLAMLSSATLPACLLIPNPSPVTGPVLFAVSGDSAAGPPPNLNPHLSKPFKLMATICKAISGPAHSPYKELVSCCFRCCLWI